MIEVVGANRMRVELETREVGHPGKSGCVARNNFFGGAPGWKAQRNDFDPGRPGLRRPLLVEVLAVDAVGIAHEDSGPSARATQRSVRNGKVVADKIQLRIARFWKEHLSWIGDRDVAPGDRQDLSLLLGSHRPRILRRDKSICPLYSVLAGPHPRSLSLGDFAPRSGRRRFPDPDWVYGVLNGLPSIS